MIRLRPYQEQALQVFQENGNRGIFDMATGTGKTFTSIACANAFYEDNKRQFLVILVPFLHLIPQWKENLDRLGILANLEIANSRDSWQHKLQHLIFDFDHRYRDRVVIIGSYKSTNSDLFGELLDSLKLKQYGFLIADECHYLGSSSSTNLDVYKRLSGRLGLSATPRRWWDENGTERIFDLFDEIVFEYSLKEAIDNNFLTHYRYYPIPVTLDFEENQRYINLSNKISKLTVLKTKNGKHDLDDKLKRLLLRRSRLLQSAGNKEETFEKIFKQQVPDFSLVYCPDGKIEKYTSIVGNNLGVRVHTFDSKTSYGKRTEILKQFAENKIQTLTAIKCLDEGVDVPATKTAYFISSTTNPRQFIQRRGRILRMDRKSGKIMADIYDLIVVPDKEEMDISVARGMVKREMPRFHEFSQYADNEFEARKVIQPILADFNLDSYMDKSAWDIYEENKREIEGL